MSYAVHNFVDGDTIYAAPINEMDQQIQQNATDISNKMDSNLKGAANGVAELDENGLVPSGQLPSQLPEVTGADDGKFLRVSNGEWAAEEIPNASGNSF